VGTLVMRKVLQPDAAAWQTSWVGERIDPLMSQITSPEQVTPGLRRELIDCWILVSNAGGAVGFPFLPVDIAHVAPVADKLFAGLSPDCSRLLIARIGTTLAGWVHIHRNPSPLVAHWGTISHLQSLPSSRGLGMGSALMVHARQVARSEMGLEQLHLALRGGTGLEPFYARLGWTVTGRWPGALRLAPGDDRDDILMILTPL
jgi:GNAT superfamily N-acetyltransferase